MTFLQRYKRSLLLLLVDSLAISMAWLCAFFLRYNLSFSDDHWPHHAIIALPVVLVVQLIANRRNSLQRIMSRYISVKDLVRIARAVIEASVVCLCLFYFTRISAQMSRSIVPLYVILGITLITLPRLLVRLFHEYAQKKHADKQRVIIIGAGRAGEGLIRDLKRSYANQYEVLGVIDDNPKRQGLELHGVRVIGTSDDLSHLIDDHRTDMVFIAIPSLPSIKMRQLFTVCHDKHVKVSTLPALSDIAEGRISMNALRPISLEDLLDRNVNIPHLDQVNDFLEGEVVCVTGGGGSIGSELCKQILAYHPKQLIICDHSEFALYTTTQMLGHAAKTEIIPALCNVANHQDLALLFRRYRPKVIFHAAAYKHVPLLEPQVHAAAKNNILGTYNVASLASEYQVTKCILVSTDKAVNPTNVMGMTKRVAERIFQYFAKTTSTDYIAVRFGNVLGSAGSVVPLFRQQIESGGPVTVTHPDITRYFMTIPEAVSLILKAMSVGQSEALYTLNMGEPVKIQFLAEKMIELSGKQLGQDIDIQYTGLRDGEKLYEELHYDFEDLVKVSEKLYLVNAAPIDITKLQALIRAILSHIEQGNAKLILSELRALVFDHRTDLISPVLG